VLTELGRGQLSQLAGLDVEAGGFKTSQDGPAKAEFLAVGLQDDEGLFHRVLLSEERVVHSSD
jgi:hypothetical protein